jgi:hypothetical protein
METTCTFKWTTYGDTEVSVAALKPALLLHDLTGLQIF